MPKDKTVKVNLGSGDDYQEGWVNVDIDTSHKIDVIADLQKPFPFNDNSVDEIKASDILEHFTKEDGEIFLKECVRILKPNGKIMLRTHNVKEIINHFGHDPEVMLHFLYGNTEESGVFGAHKYGYTENSLRKILHMTGLRITSIKTETTNFVVHAVKEKKPSQKRLHIAVIQQTPDIGGAETYMYSLVEHFIRNGDKVSVATNLHKFAYLFKDINVPITKIPVILDYIGNIRGLIKSTFFLPFAFFFYLNLLSRYKKQGVDVILMSGFSEKILVSLLSKIFHLPVVWIEYGPLEIIFNRLFKIPKILYRLGKEIPQAVIIPSNYTKQSLMRHGRVSLAKLKLIPCGISVPKKIEKKKQTFFPQEKDSIIIGTVSRLTEEKGQQILIKAIPHIVKVIPSARFIIVGGGDINHFQKIVNNLKVQKYVTLTGFVPSTIPYYQQMDIFVFPTIWDLEGFGVVSLEAMSYQLPVVASRTGPVPEVVKDNVTGLLFTPGNEKELAKCVVSLIKDQKKRLLLGKQGRRRVETLYKIESVSQQIRDVLVEATL